MYIYSHTISCYIESYYIVLYSILVKHRRAAGAVVAGPGRALRGRQLGGPRPRRAGYLLRCTFYKYDVVFSCVVVYIYIYIYRERERYYTYMYAYYICIYTYVCACMYIYIYIYIHTY